MSEHKPEETSNDAPRELDDEELDEVAGGTSIHYGEGLTP